MRHEKKERHIETTRDKNAGAVACIFVPCYGVIFPKLLKSAILLFVTYSQILDRR